MPGPSAAAMREGSEALARERIEYLKLDKEGLAPEGLDRCGISVTKLHIFGVFPIPETAFPGILRGNFKCETPFLDDVDHPVPQPPRYPILVDVRNCKRSHRYLQHDHLPDFSCTPA